MYTTRKRRNGNASKFNSNSSSRNSNRRGTSKPNIDISKFINKQIAPEVIETPVPTGSFSNFNIDAGFLNQIKERGYITPTEIQQKAVPHILEGKDLIGIAGTGTGKTGAFLIPIIQKLLTSPQHYYSLIVTPTRELATQVEDEFKKLSLGMKLFSTTLIGGTNMGKSMRALSRPNHLVIGTPGRILDMADRGKLPLNKFSMLVLDEFDRMLDMGFVRDIDKITGQMGRRGQTLLFSATMDPSQKSTIQKLIKNPITVKAATALRSANSVAQDVVRVSEGADKFNMLYDLISDEHIDDRRIILFCETKRKANKISKRLKESGIPSDEIHGNKSQNARERSLGRFKKGHIQVLVATDVMARGIDVSDVSMVINYEVPKTYDDYIHRIGRTGRAGKTGKAITFID